jgi:predicted RNA-binding protein with RPS1 domain
VKPTVTFEELSVGDVVRGTVKNVVEKMGVFIIIKNSDNKLSGLCHISEVPDAALSLRVAFAHSRARRSRRAS